MTGRSEAWQRRERLFRIHSALRSADNLRPDEAFDELVKLYRAWVELRPARLDDVVCSQFDIALSQAAVESAGPPLWSLLSEADDGFGADLFQELADVGVRSGLGQYFTPAPVAEAMADYLAPQPGEAWMDPFLGSGLLLGATARAASGPLRLYGSDLDARVLRLAELESRLRHPDVPLNAARISALEDPATVLASVTAPRHGVDGVVTNPPFGALDLSGNGKNGFKLASGRRTPLEVLGLEQSLRLLKPGGRLGIVLPQSVLSNRRLQHVRSFLRQHSRVDGVLSLPGETFGLFEGVGKASVVFATKAKPANGVVWFGRASSIGWDSTGRPADNEDVRQTAAYMRSHQVRSGVVEPRPIGEEMDRNLTAEWQLRVVGDGLPLDDLADGIFLGKTPARADYGSKEEPGMLRVLKVGNLTGHGVDWADGTRSYARYARVPTDRLLSLGDIALTAAAHHPRYIAAKVDVIDTLPNGWAESCLPAGEVLVIRPRPGTVDPLGLLLWLRSPQGRTALQACVTGQTAHLHPEDVAEVRVPRTLATVDLSAATTLLHKSLEARRQFEELETAAVAQFRRLAS